MYDTDKEGRGGPAQGTMAPIGSVISRHWPGRGASQMVGGILHQEVERIVFTGIVNLFSAHRSLPWPRSILDFQLYRRSESSGREGSGSAAAQFNGCARVHDGYLEHDQVSTG